SGAQGQTGNMSPWNAQGPHESGDVVRECLCRISSLGGLAFTGSAKIERNASEVLAIFGNLESVTGVIGGQVRNQNERVAGSLLFIVDGDVVGFYFRHAASP